MKEDAVKTEYTYELPKGFIDDKGQLHKDVAIREITGAIGLFALHWLPLAKAGMSTFASVTRRAIPTFIGWGKAVVASARAGKLHSIMTMDVGKAMKGLITSMWAGVKAAVAWTASTVKDIAVKAAHAASVVAGTVATWASVAASKAAAAAQWLWNAAMVRLRSVRCLTFDLASPGTR